MRFMLAAWALALHGAAAFSPSGVNLPGSRLAGSSMPFGARPAVGWKPAVNRAGTTQLLMATVPKIIQGGMGIQVRDAFIITEEFLRATVRMIWWASGRFRLGSLLGRWAGWVSWA